MLTRLTAAFLLSACGALGACPVAPPTRCSGGANQEHDKGPDRQGAEADPASSSACPTSSHLLWLEVAAALRAE